MAINEAFIAELKFEAAATRKMLERVPMDRKEWKPHAKSMSVGRLATHIAETVHWISVIKRVDDFDFLASPIKSETAVSSEALVGLLDKNVEEAVKDLSIMTDEDMNKIWTVRRGEHVVMQLPKKVAIRSWGLSHQIHHRGQLSVMLRLLDVPVPGMYGPSFDEKSPS